LGNKKYIKTLIFGSRSNLSIKLHTSIKNSELIYGINIINDERYLEKYRSDECIQIIINSFYPSHKLNNYLDPLKYIQESILILATLLEQIKLFSLKVKKIIYTSSASVYGTNNYCTESDNLMPLNLQSSLKVSCEKLVIGFCDKMNINYAVTRVFNMYGGNDKFSIISKIIDSVERNSEMTLINNGMAIRDFIHIDDVVYCYIKLLNLNESQIINVASGEGISIKMIVDYLKIKGYQININNSTRNEIKVSIANVENLKVIFNVLNFKSVIQFIEIALKNK